MLVASEEWETAEIFIELVEDLALSAVEDRQLDSPDLVLLDAGGRHVYCSKIS
jgi:hypothetical protein